MRRRRIILFILSAIAFWIAGTYLIFDRTQDCPGCQTEYADVSPKGISQVKFLEVKVDELVKVNDLLFKDIKSHMQEVRANALVNKIRVFNSYAYLNKRGLKQKLAKNNKIEDDVIDDNKKLMLENDNRNAGIKRQSSSSDNSIPVFASLNSSIEETQLATIPKSILPDGRPVIAILVFSCNRVTVRRCLDRLLRFRPSKEQFPIIVSQDCMHKQTTDTILSYGEQLIFMKQPDQREIQVPLKEKKFKGYFKIARHYGWALNQTFYVHGFSTIIIVEDDLEIAEDFFEYFLGTYWILRADPSTWCVSAWNDNGNEVLVDESQSQLLYRTDFFPGLGWMLTNTLWSELSRKWPLSYWDDWIRKPEQRKGRACIRPEVSRTKTFGKIGVSNGMFYEKHLKFIKLNQEFVSFSKLNLTYLQKDIYDVMFEKEVYDSPAVSYFDVKAATFNIESNVSVRIAYRTKDEYKKAAKYLGLMDDFRSGVPRTAYRGIVSFAYKGRRVYLAPEKPWRGYDLSWS